MGTRIGDLLHVGKEWLLVQEVIDETHLRLQLYPDTSGHKEAPATLHVGDGYHEESFNDNNLCVLRDCLFRNNAGAGAKLCGLFGARVQNGQFDFNRAYGAVVGTATDPSSSATSSGATLRGMPRQPPFSSAPHRACMPSPPTAT